ncbi:MAG: hypothetical protein GTN62_05780 [Gemmatimonadales bacterium]|nr:hypothetical protein [Gemmatimonadales bacterium]NIN11009.1 hypothetical protein [Gemmatimonadales bacterium]NIN49606.1 hypothetical protein [Gemmatimonadales bacterium]NIP07070.1 hypothetical protein [Gemmatimonadales bacterium]NIQ99461.1 hypothetical protein [Gemmatimonadales bacterium]
MTRTERSALVTMAVLLLMGCGERPREAAEEYAPTIDPARFVAQVDNEFFPLTAGTTLIYEEAGGGERVETYVTHETREVMGVQCVVVYSKEFEDDQLTEETWDWYAQDQDGNVWYFGEDTREYKDGELVGTGGSWEAGRDGALPGIIMQGAPQVGVSYRQEYYVGEAEDMGEVLSLSDSATVPYGTFGGVLVTRDWTPLEPGDEERGYYARGVGLILEIEEDDRLELVSVSQDSTDAS